MTTTAGAAEVAVDVWLPRHPEVPGYLSGIRRVAASFHDLHPEYVITIREADVGTLPEEVRAASLQGRPPALVQFPHTTTQLARDMLSGSGTPLFASVHEAVAGRREILGHPVVTGDILAAARACYSSDGELMAVPSLISTTLLYANTDLLAAAGVTRLPQTWNEVEGVCEAVRGLPGVSHGITWPNHGWLFQQAVAQSGGLLADHGNGRRGRAEKMLLDSPEMLAFVGWWRRMHRQGRYLYTGQPVDGESVRQAWEDTFSAFVEQKVAFILGSSAEADRLARAGRERGFGVAAGRTPYSGRFPFAGTLIGGDAIWLVDGLEPDVRDGALAFLQYLMTPAHVAERHCDTGFAPATGAATKLLTAQGWFEEHPQAAVTLDQLAASDRSPAALGALIGDLTRIQGVMTQAMHDVLLGEEDPVWRFASANAEAQRLLDEYNVRGRGGPDCGNDPPRRLR
ncbi:extracellular solute-binding protein [Catenulispora rubra]|uniref:extracellular solute-binding protein n=1 Tax=Catenulispora rubra TaxID=280293 RepID=UPI0018927859|nr:extracellular solute-binding protein [Catenulispora rubra]